MRGRWLPALLFLGCSAYEPDPLDGRRILEELRAVRIDLPSAGLLPDQAVAIALVHNPELRTWRREHEIAEQLVLSEGAWANPEFRPGVENLLSSGGNPLTLALGLRLFPPVPGESAAKLARAEARERKILAQVESREAAVAARTQIAHARAVMAGEKLRILEAARRLHERLGAAIDRRLIGYAATRLDEALALLAREELENERFALEAERRGALEELGSLLGAAPGAISNVRTPPQDKNGLPDRSQEDLENDALKRPDLRALQEEYEEKEQSLRLAHLARVPWPRFLEPGVEKLPRNYSLELGAAFEIPIFNSGSAEIAVAEAARRKARDVYAARLHAARGEIRQAALQLKEAERRRRHCAERVDPMLIQAEELVKAVLDAGETDVLKLIAIEMRVLNARRDAAQAAFDAERARIELALALGSILPKP